jgi:hypothetical protein
MFDVKFEVQTHIHWGGKKNKLCMNNDVGLRSSALLKARHSVPRATRSAVHSGSDDQN